MAVTLNANGITFGDATSQNTAATAGTSLTAVQVAGYTAYGSGSPGGGSPGVGNRAMTASYKQSNSNYQNDYNNTVFVGFQSYVTSNQQASTFYNRTYYRTVS